MNPKFLFVLLSILGLGESLSECTKVCNFQSICWLGNALRCTQCGDDGVCKEGVEEKNVECKADQLSCFISLTTLEDGKIVDTKGCLDQGSPQVTEMRGCIHISGPDNVSVFTTYSAAINNLY